MRPATARYCGVTSPSEEPERRFPVSPPPVGVSWSGSPTEPIIGPEAEADLRGIRKWHPFRGQWLVHKIRHLLDNPIAATGEKVRDPLGVGPRYACDLGKGYAAVCWVLEPPDRLSGLGLRLWVERVVEWTTLTNALEAMAPKDE